MAEESLAEKLARKDFSPNEQTEAADEAASPLEGESAAVEAERSDPEVNTLEPAGQLEVRSISKRELGIFLLPWDTEVDTHQGREMFERGAFEGVDPQKVRLRMDHQDPPTGVGLTIEERDEGPYMTFRVAKTQRGDDQIALAAEGVSTGASVGFVEIPGGTEFRQRNGRRIRVHRRVDLREVSTTWRPVYERAAVMSIRSQEEAAAAAQEGAEVAPMPETTAPENNGATPEAVTSAPAPVQFDFSAFQSSLTSAVNSAMSPLAERMAAVEERARADFQIPNPHQDRADGPSLAQWTSAALRILSGERIPDIQMRQLADIITTDNAGVVPDAFLAEIVGVIDPARPFMQTTRRLNTPSNGMSLVLPRIVTKPTVGVQETEKTELTSTATAVDTVTFDAATYGGAGDISLQLLKRSSPEFLDLYLRLLAEAYALETEAASVAAILAAGVASGGTLDPEALALGSAWSTAVGAINRGPDTIWMSSPAVAEFIDAKADGTNSPLYSQLSANFTAGGGVGGSIQGLRAVYVPALDATDIDVLVGPSNGFAWAEDGTYTLQVDVPAKAGRDVAIVGMIWPAPLYPSAFTAYVVGTGGS